MDGMRNGASRSSAARAASGEVSVDKANETASAVSSLLGMLQSPAANGYLLTQKLALESAIFWARRMRAYADQMEALAQCTSPNQFAAAQTQFIERMRDDYANETAAVSEMVITPKTARERREQPSA